MFVPFRSENVFYNWITPAIVNWGSKKEVSWTEVKQLQPADKDEATDRDYLNELNNA